MFNFGRLAQPVMPSKEEVAEYLRTDKEALEAFERKYSKQVLGDYDGGDLSSVNAKQAARMHGRQVSPEARGIVGRVVQELLAETATYRYDGEKADTSIQYPAPDKYVAKEEILSLGKGDRPQLTGTMMQRQIAEEAYRMLLFDYHKYKTGGTKKERMQYYHMFRQGLDIVDLDPVVYAIIGTNPVSMGYWLPALVEAVGKQPFFKVPATTVIKVPLTLLQLTRLDYGMLSPTTLEIVDEYAKRAFALDESKEYFIKTGTYSSKFDFRNAYVHGAKEVGELGEYLLFIHWQALQMASPLNRPSIYGVSTTNEWVVREFIKDKEGNPSIYKGLPLHTEYRVFVDFDDDIIIGMSPYWEPNLMKNRFGHMDDADSPHQKHDYIIYCMHEDTLMGRYRENEGKVKGAVEKMLPDIDLPGQWSMDIMQNGDDFYIIDMAPAMTSALKECIPKHLLKDMEEDWIPKIPELL